MIKMKALPLLLLSLPVQAMPPIQPDHQEWFVEQITQTSTDSGGFFTDARAGHPEVTLLRFATRELCEDALAKLGVWRSGVDFPMGTGSYFARLGVVFSVCLRSK